MKAITQSPSWKYSGPGLSRKIICGVIWFKKEAKHCVDPMDTRSTCGGRVSECTPYHTMIVIEVKMQTVKAHIYLTIILSKYNSFAILIASKMKMITWLLKAVLKTFSLFAKKPPKMMLNESTAEKMMPLMKRVFER